MTIVLIIKALITAVALFFAFYIGRCSATHDIYNVRIGNRENMPDDIIQWVNYWDNKRMK